MRWRFRLLRPFLKENPMKLRPLGRSGIDVSPLCFGGNVFGWTADEATSHAMLDRFVDAGFNFVDTANVYSFWIDGHQGGESESVIGRWFRKSGKRDRVVLATKVGMAMPQLGAGLDRKRIEQSVEDSLRRLQTDRIDLFYAHADDDKTPLEETLAAFDRLVKAGKVRALGASQIQAPRLAEALDTAERAGLTPYSVLQTWYNLVDRPRYEGALSELVAARGLATTAFYGLANGYLTGKYRTRADLSKSIRGDRALPYMEGNGPKVLAALDEVAAEAGATPAQVALAWLAAQPSVTPIASATKVEQVEELLGVLNLELSADQLARLSAASA